jgi:hypothetical protein
MRTVVVLIVMVVGCGEVVTVPEPVGLSEQLEATEVNAPSDASAATTLVLRSFSEQFGVTMPMARVRWFGEQLPIGEQLATGICFSCDAVWVWTDPDRRMRDTALAHELAHCARLALGLDAGAAHDDPTWWAAGGFVSAAQHALIASGL